MPRCPAMQPQLRRAAVPHDLDVAPQYSMRMPGPERLHCRLLRREPAGEVNCRHLAPHTVGHFTVGEYAPHEPFAVTFDGVGDTVDVGGVQTETQDV